MPFERGGGMRGSQPPFLQRVWRGRLRTRTPPPGFFADTCAPRGAARPPAICPAVRSRRGRQLDAATARGVNVERDRTNAGRALHGHNHPPAMSNAGSLCRTSIAGDLSQPRMPSLRVLPLRGETLRFGGAGVHRHRRSFAPTGSGERCAPRLVCRHTLLHRRAGSKSLGDARQTLVG